MSTATDIQHQPWCRDHCTEDDHPEQPGWCHHTVLEVGEPRHQRMGVSIQPRMHDNADAGIECYTDDDKLSPDEARRLAAALLKAADVLEAASTPMGPELPTADETAELIRQGDKIMRAKPNQAGEAARRLDGISAAAIARRAVQDVT